MMQEYKYIHFIRKRMESAKEISFKKKKRVENLSFLCYRFNRTYILFSPSFLRTDIHKIIRVTVYLFTIALIARINVRIVENETPVAAYHVTCDTRSISKQYDCPFQVK